MSDFGVSQALSDLSLSDVERVVHFIKTDMGVQNENYLSVIEEKDFTEAKVLSKVHARSLIYFWKTGVK